MGEPFLYPAKLWRVIFVLVICSLFYSTAEGCDANGESALVTLLPSMCTSRTSLSETVSSTLADVLTSLNANLGGILTSFLDAANAQIAALCKSTLSNINAEFWQTCPEEGGTTLRIVSDLCLDNVGTFAVGFTYRQVPIVGLNLVTPTELQWMLIFKTDSMNLQYLIPNTQLSFLPTMSNVLIIGMNNMTHTVTFPSGFESLQHYARSGFTGVVLAGEVAMPILNNFTTIVSGAYDTDKVSLRGNTSGTLTLIPNVIWLDTLTTYLNLPLTSSASTQEADVFGLAATLSISNLPLELDVKIHKNTTAFTITGFSNTASKLTIEEIDLSLNQISVELVLRNAVDPLDYTQCSDFITCMTTGFNSNRSVTATIAASATLLDQNLDVSIKIKKRGSVFGMLLTLQGAQSTQVGGGFTVQAVLTELFGIDTSTWQSVWFLGPYLTKLLTLGVRNIDLSLPFFGVYDNSTGVFNADIDFDGTAIPLNLVHAPGSTTSTTNRHLQPLQLAAITNSLRMVFTPANIAMLLTYIPQLSWASGLLYTMSVLVYLGDETALNQIANETLPFDLTVTSGGGIIAVVDLESDSAGVFLQTIGSLASLSKALIQVEAQSDTQLQLSMSLKFNRAYVLLGYLSTLNVWIRESNTSCMNAGFDGQMELSLFNLIMTDLPIVSVSGQFTCPASVQFAFSLAQWTHPFGIPFMTFYDVAFTANVNIQSQSVDKVSFYGSLDVGDAGTLYNMQGFFLSDSPPTYGFSIGYPTPIPYIDLATFVVNVTHLTPPDWMYAILNIVVLQNVSASVLVGNLTQYRLQNGVTIPLGISAHVGRFCMLWGLICGKADFKMVYDSSLSLKAAVEDFALFNLIQISNVSLDWEIEASKSHMVFTGASTIFNNITSTSVLLLVDGGYFNLSFTLSLFNLITFDISALGELAFASGSECPLNMDKCLKPLSDLSYDVSVSNELQSFIDSLKTTLWNTISTKFSWVIDAYNTARTVLNTILYALQPLAKILGITLPSSVSKKFHPFAVTANVETAKGYLADAFAHTTNSTYVRTTIVSIISVLSDEPVLQYNIGEAVAGACTVDERRAILQTLVLLDFPDALMVTVLNQLPASSDNLTAAVTAKVQSFTEDEVNNLLLQAISICQSDDRPRFASIVLDVLSDATVINAVLPVTNFTIYNYTSEANTGILSEQILNNTKETLRRDLIAEYGNDSSALLDQVIDGNLVNWDLFVNGVLLLTAKNCSTYLDLLQAAQIDCAETGLSECSRAAQLHVLYVVCVNEKAVIENSLTHMIRSALVTVGVIPADQVKYNVKWGLGFITDLVKKVVTTVVNGITYAADYIAQKWKEYTAKLAEWTSQLTIVNAAKTLVTTLSNLETAFTLDYVKLNGSLVDAVTNGEVVILVSGKFFGVSCCPPITVGINSDLVSFASTVFSQVLTAPLSVLFKSSKFTSLATYSNEDGFLTVDDPLTCFPDWNVVENFTVMPSEQSWVEYIESGCDGNCTLSLAPNLTTITTSVRPPTVVNHSWFLYSFVCGAYYEVGHRIVYYSDGSVMGFDFKTGSPGWGPVSENATILNVTYTKDVPHYTPYASPDDPTADLWANASEYAANHSRPTDVNGTSVITPENAEVDPGTANFSGNHSSYVTGYCTYYRCLNGLRYSHASTIACLGACTDAVCCYDPLSQTCGAVLEGACPTGYSPKSSTSNLYFTVCSSTDSCTTACCDALICQLPSSAPIGYQFTGSSSGCQAGGFVSMATATSRCSGSLQCATGYSGTPKITCATNGTVATLSGCTPRTANTLKCTLPTLGMTYDTSKCVGSLTETQCVVTCLSPSVGTISVTCDTSGVFTIVGTCEIFTPGVCGNGVIDWAHGEQCEPPNRHCCNTHCKFKPKSVVCRPAPGDCQLEARCTGISGRCPSNIKQPDGLSCNQGKAYWLRKSFECYGGKCMDSNEVPHPHHGHRHSSETTTEEEDSNSTSSSSEIDSSSSESSFPGPQDEGSGSGQSSEPESSEEMPFPPSYRGRARRHIRYHHYAHHTHYRRRRVYSTSSSATTHSED